MRDSATRLNGQVFLWTTLIAAVGYFYFDHSSLRPYIPAAIPLAVIAQAFWLAIRHGARIALNPLGIQLFCAYLLVCLLALLFNQTVDFYTVRKILLPATALLIPVFVYEIDHRSLQRFFVALFLLGLLIAGTETAQASGISANMFSTSSATESVFGLSLGAGAVWMAANRRLVWSVLLLGACFVLFKRVAIFDAVFCIAVFACVSLAPMPMRKPVIRTITFCIAAAFIAASFYLNDIFNTVSAQLSGITAERLSTGRTDIYRAILYDLGNNGITEWLFGHGPGAVERMIVSTTFLNPLITLPHNEYFSLIYDFGLLGCLGILLALFRFSRANTSAALIVLYMMVMILIENLFFISFVFMTLLFLTSFVPVARSSRAAAAHPMPLPS